MSNYQKRKESARQKAIDWQYSFEDQSYSYGELYEWQTYFISQARRYGLTREFRENGVI